VKPGRPAHSIARRRPADRRGHVTGALSFSTLRAVRDMARQLVPRLRLLAEVFAKRTGAISSRNGARESEDRFRLLADTAPLMICCPAPTPPNLFNRRWLELTGPDRRRTWARAGEDSVHADGPRAAGRVVPPAVSAPSPSRSTTGCGAGTATTGGVLDHGVPRIDENGAFTGYVGSVTISRR